MSGHPHIGEIVYGDRDQSNPWLVVGHDDTAIILVPAGTTIRRTHKGNVYNEKGEGEWQE